MRLFSDGPSRDRLFQLCAAGYAVALFSCTHWPRVTVPGVHVVGLPLDKVAHLGLYLGLALLVSGACGLWRVGRGQRLVVCFLGILAFAAFDEVTQAWFRRTPDVLDWVADGVGAAVGLLGLRWLYQSWRIRAYAQGELG